jgi:hypothetical protein
MSPGFVPKYLFVINNPLIIIFPLCTKLCAVEIEGASFNNSIMFVGDINKERTNLCTKLTGPQYLFDPRLN